MRKARKPREANSAQKQRKAKKIEKSTHKFKKSRLEVHKQLFEELCAIYNKLLESTERSNYRQKIENSNTKYLFRMIDGVFTAR